MLLAGDFCSPGCSEHCVLARWWDGYAKGFNGKKNARQQPNTHLFWIFPSVVAASSHYCCVLLKSWFALTQTDFLICSGVCCRRKGWSRCVSCRCCLMLFIRVVLPFALLDVNSKALTHCTCAKLFTQASFVLTGCFEYLNKVLSAKLLQWNHHLTFEQLCTVRRPCQFSLLTR